MRPSPSSIRPSRAGFTIMDLLVVLLLIAVVASLAIPAYFDRSEITLENACDLLAEEIRSAQNRAAYLGIPLHVVFTEDGDGYEVFDAGGRGINNPSTGRPFRRCYSQDGVFEGVRIVSVQLGGTRSLAIDEHGRVVDGGFVVLAFEGDRRRARIAEISGEVRVEPLPGPGWGPLD